MAFTISRPTAVAVTLAWALALPALAATQSEAPDLIIESEQAGADMGTGSPAGDVNGDGYGDLLVGARLYDSGQTDEGLVLVFHGSANGVVGHRPSQAHTRIESNQSASEFGRTVGCAGDVNGDGYDDIVIGIPFFDGDAEDTGAVAVFLGSAVGIVAEDLTDAATLIVGSESRCYLGIAVAGAGDVDDDGFDDIVVGGWKYGANDEGAVLVFRGSRSGITATGPDDADTVIVSNQPYSDLGVAVAGAGDVNGDGFADIVAGARRYDWTSGDDDRGAAFVFLGSPSGIAASLLAADTVIAGDQDAALFAGGMAGAGDLNSDGFDDIVVSAQRYDSGESDEGAAFVFYGAPSGIAATTCGDASAVIEANQDLAKLVGGAEAGDVNGDGFDDLLIGIPEYDTTGQANAGVALLFFGSADGVVGGGPTDADLRYEAGQAGATLSAQLSGGDFDHDGFSELVLAARLYDGPIGGADAGAVMVAYGRPRISAAFALDPPDPIRNEEVHFSDQTTGSPGDWSWDFGDGGSSSAQNPTHRFEHSGTWSVCLTASRASVASTACRDVEVTELAAGFSYSPPRPLVGEPVQLADWSQGSPAGWQWAFGDGGTSSQASPVHAFDQAGDAQVCQVVYKRGAADTVCRAISVVAEPTPDDGVCQPGETATSSPADCAPAVCGDAFCHLDETFFSCPDDCLEAECGNGQCETGESSWGCPQDCELSAGATNRLSKSCTSCNLPAVAGGVPGTAGTFWLSEAMVTNPGQEPALVTLTYTPDLVARQPEAFGPFVLEPGEVGYFANFIRQVFGEIDNGSLRVRSDRPLMLFSRTFNQVGVKALDGEGGTYGQNVGAWSPDQVFGSDDTAYVLGVAEDGETRTNLLVQEVTGKKTYLLVTVYRQDGTQVGSTTVSVEPYRKRQVSLASLGYGDLADAYATVEVVSGGQVATLASVVDNGTGDPRTVAAVERRQVYLGGRKVNGVAQDAHYLVAAIARTEGALGSRWRSRLEIQNPFPGSQTVRLTYYPGRTGSVMTSTVTLAEGQQLAYEDAVDELFAGAPVGQGSLHVVAPSGVLVTSSTYSLAVEGTFGQFIPALAGGDLLAVDETGTLLGLAEGAAMRTNIGFAEYDGVETDVEVSLWEWRSFGQGATYHQLATKTYTVPASRNLQVNRVFLDMGVEGAYQGAWATITPVSGGRVYAYASKIDNITQDPTFIPAQR